MNVALEKISAADFDKFRTLFYRKTGIHFEDTKRYYVANGARSAVKNFSKNVCA